MAGMIQLLIVDDEKDFVTYMTKRLEHHDIEVHAFTNPVEALEKTKGNRFDVGLLDLKMPDMDGEELLNKLKERDPRMELIILTGHGSIESAFRSAKSGAYEYLLKPCDFDGVVNSINNAYAKRIKALSQGKAAEVDNLLEQADKLRPLELLKRLKKIHDGMENYLTAVALAEGGDYKGAKELLHKRSKKGTN